MLIWLLLRYFKREKGEKEKHSVWKTANGVSDSYPLDTRRRRRRGENDQEGASPLLLCSVKKHRKMARHS